MNLWLSGIYDLATFNYLKTLGIQKFSFDFRPRSLTFIQEHKMQEIISSSGESTHQYHFIFENEKDFVIDKIMNEMQTKRVSSSINEFSMEFTGKGTAQDFDKFKLPYYWHYSTQVSHLSFLNSHFFKGYIFHTDDLEYMSRQGDLYHFFKSLFENVKGQNKKIEIVLYINEEMSLPKSIIDFFPFDSIILPITSKVETSYRNININVLHDHIRLVEQMVGLSF